jgi:hypothetical protein
MAAFLMAGTWNRPAPRTIKRLPINSFINMAVLSKLISRNYGPARTGFTPPAQGNEGKDALLIVS